jgi:hypothetical protein
MIYTKLRKKLKDAHDSIPELQSIRFHRSISWIKAAEDHEKEVDIKLITLWIAFNSLYAIENTKNESLINSLVRILNQEFITYYGTPIAEQ